MGAYSRNIVRRSTALTSTSFTNSESARQAVQADGANLAGPVGISTVRCKRKSGTGTNDITVRGYSASSGGVEMFEQTFSALADEDTDSQTYAALLPLVSGEVFFVTFENSAADASTAEFTADYEVTK
jgi:hypothetical protein